MTVKYNVITPVFTALTDILPLSDQAVNGVAIFGLAALLSVSNNLIVTNYYEGKYATAKSTWRSHPKTPSTQVTDVYALNDEW